MTVERLRRFSYLLRFTIASRGKKVIFVELEGAFTAQQVSEWLVVAHRNGKFIRICCIRSLRHARVFNSVAFFLGHGLML